MQLDMFGNDVVIRPRPYQKKAIEAAEENWEKGNRASLIVLPTGAGKSVVAGEIVRRFVKETGRRVLVLAHRSELVNQMVGHMKRAQLSVTVDKGSNWSDRSLVVVATPQTLSSERRLAHVDRLGPPGLIVTDECHHFSAPSFRRSVDKWKAALLLGITATPTRTDKRDLGELFPRVTFSMTIQDGIEEGFLAPVVAKSIVCANVNLDDVSSVAGDLEAGALDREMQKAAESIASEVVHLGGPRRGIIFTPGLATAEYIAGSLNRIEEGSAEFVSGKCKDRAKKIGSFLRGEYRYLVNCQLLTEGFDAPDVSLVAIARPTKSAGLFIQMAGRGLRLHRDKKDCLLLDFSGNSSRHTLITPVTLFSHGYTPKEVERAKEIIEEREEDPQQALKSARRELAQIARQTKAEMLSSRRVSWNPFELLGVSDYGCGLSESNFELATPGQVRYLVANGIIESEAKKTTKRGAARLISEIRKRQGKRLATPKQIAYIRMCGEEAPKGMSLTEASKLIDTLKKREQEDF